LIVGEFVRYSDGVEEGYTDVYDCRRDGAGVIFTGAREEGFLVEVGDVVGFLEGASEGSNVGDKVGKREDGRVVGFLVTLIVGPLVRKTVGYDVGVEEDRGREDGWSVGDDEGINVVRNEDGLAVVGLLVGSTVGRSEGSDVGAEVEER